MEPARTQFRRVATAESVPPHLADSMIVAELTYPGSFIENEPRESAHQARTLLYVAESHLAEAAISLSQFAATRGGDPSAEARMEDSRRRGERKREIEEEMRADLDDPWDRERMDEIRFEAERRVRREEWQNGKLPQSYRHQLPILNAKMFVYSLDALEKILRVLEDEDAAPEPVGDAHDRFVESFGSLRDVRNSSLHIEDRARGLDHRSEPLDLEPVDTDAIKAESGALILNSLEGASFGATSADGEYERVDVTVDSLQEARDCLQDAIDAFDWRGPKSISPR